MGWVLFSFHLQRSYSLVVFNECATIVLAIDKGAADVYDDNRKRKKPRSGTR